MVARFFLLLALFVLVTEVCIFLSVAEWTKTGGFVPIDGSRQRRRKEHFLMATEGPPRLTFYSYLYVL